MDLLGPTDPQFCLALDYYLRDRGWTIQRFCDLAAEVAPEGFPLIHPHNFSDWRSRSHPSNRSVLAVCQVLGVSRSRFFKIAEELWQLRLAEQRIGEEEKDRAVELLKGTVANLREREDLERLIELEEAIRRQRAKLQGR